MKYINTLHEGDVIQEVYLCKTKTVAKTKAGKTYYSLLLQDKTATVDGKIWELNNGIEHFEAMDYIYIDAQVTSFNDSLQINIKRLRRAREGEFDPADYMPTSNYNNDEMYNQLLRLIDSIKQPQLKQLLNSFFVEDAEFIKKFRSHSAAKSIHHGFIGGLLQHTLSVAQICDFYALHYPELNRDLLVTAAICHDIGKVEEISSFPENDYTDDGNLLGHIVIGSMMIKDKMKDIPDMPKVLGQELIHCILSHHGKLEYGSPKTPSLIEAVALSHADDTDAKIETFAEILKKGDDKKTWLGFNKMLDSNIRYTTE